MLTPRTCAAISQQLGLTKRRQKFNARGVVVNGIRFGSEKEYRYWWLLAARENGGELSELRVHPIFLLFVNGRACGRFTPDFCCRENGETAVYEVKSPATRRLSDYRLRVKLFRACYPTVRFVEVT